MVEDNSWLIQYLLIELNADSTAQKLIPFTKVDTVQWSERSVFVDVEKSEITQLEDVRANELGLKERAFA